MTKAKNVEEYIASSKSKKSNADCHKGEMIPLANGKHPCKEHFKS